VLLLLYLSAYNTDINTTSRCRGAAYQGVAEARDTARLPCIYCHVGPPLHLRALPPDDTTTRNLKPCLSKMLLSVFSLFPLRIRVSLAQEARGDVTLIPDATLTDYRKLISNMDRFDELERKVKGASASAAPLSLARAVPLALARTKSKPESPPPHRSTLCRCLRRSATRCSALAASSTACGSRRPSTPRATKSASTGTCTRTRDYNCRLQGALANERAPMGVALLPQAEVAGLVAWYCRAFFKCQNAIDRRPNFFHITQAKTGHDDLHNNLYAAGRK